MTQSIKCFRRINEYSRTTTVQLLDPQYSTSKVLNTIVEECYLTPNCNSEVIKYSDSKDIIVLSNIVLKILDNAMAL